MEEQNLPNCQFQFDGKMLDIKSEKIREADGAEKIKVTIIASQGEDSDTLVRVFKLENGFEDQIKNFIGDFVDEILDITNNWVPRVCPANPSVRKMDEENLPNCHFQFDGKMLDIKSEKIKEADEAEKIKVTVITSQGEDSGTSVRVFRLENGFEDLIKKFIGEYADEILDITKPVALRILTSLGLILIFVLFIIAFIILREQFRYELQ